MFHQFKNLNLADHQSKNLNLADAFYILSYINLLSIIVIISNNNFRSHKCH